MDFYQQTLGFPAIANANWEELSQQQLGMTQHNSPFYEI
jgi:hypothetical protein